MSELRDWIAKKKTEWPKTWCSLSGPTLDTLERLVAAHDTKIRAEQMEIDCRVVCIYCRLIGSPTKGRSGGYHHAGFQCVAESIRVAWAKAHPEEAQGE